MFLVPRILLPFHALVTVGWIVPLQLSLLSLLFFVSLSEEGKLGPANDDERHIQKAISTTSLGAKPPFRPFPSLTRVLFAIPDRAAFLKSILIGPPVQTDLT